jgi:hypothetical protein
MGHYENKTLIYEKFVKENKCICANGMQENGRMYLHQVFQFNVINVSITYP